MSRTGTEIGDKVRKMNRGDIVGWAIWELLKLSVAFGTAACITALVASIFGAIDTIISKKKKPYNRPSALPKLD